MNKSRINILIVEDDPAQGKALYEVFSRAGFSTVWCNSSVQGLTHAQRTEFHCLIIDCMLPKMNGVDLVEEILPLMPNKPKIFLMTGIFKDRKFIKDAMDRTKADTFFVKPLDLEALLAHVEGSFAHLMGPETPPVLRLYSSDSLRDEDVTALLEKDSTLHAFHLPKLYQRIQETNLTGELTLISAVGDISAVNFFHGRVFSVKTPDKDSYFGSLAVSHGFVSPEEVLEALKTPPDTKMLGQKLIDSMSLSPHAIQVVLEEQLALRLSQTVQDDVVSMQWVPKKFTKPDYTLAETRFEHLVEDWLESKITADWVKSTLMVWGPFLMDGEYHPRIRGSFTIEEIFSNAGFNEERDVGPMFRALMKNLAFIGARGDAQQDFSFLESRLNKMITDFKIQNYFQFLGVGESAQKKELSRAYEGLKESFSPENLPANTPPELAVKCTKVFQMIEKAYSTLSDDVERLRYLHSQQNKRAQEMLEAEPIFRAATVEVQNGHFEEAATKLQGLLDRKLEFRDLRSYRIWAGLKTNRNFSGLRLDQIPPEQRHSAAYMMARGVYHRTKGQYKKALESFRTAHILDPRMSIAKFELQQLMLELQNNSKNRDLLGEVTSVVENLFGKIGGRRGA